MKVLSVLLLVALVAVDKRGVSGLPIQTTTSNFTGHGNLGEKRIDPKLNTEASQGQISIKTGVKATEENGEMLPKNTRPKRNSNPFGNSNGLTPTDYYLHLMSMLKSNNVGQHPPVSVKQLVEADTDFVEDEEEDAPIELYGGNPYPFISESAEKEQRLKGNAEKETISLMRSRLPSSGPVEIGFDDVPMTHRHNADRQARSPGRIGPINGLVTQFRVANSNREHSPFERRVFSGAFQRLAKRSFGPYYG